MELSEILGLNLDDLRNKCAELGLEASGQKTVLQERLIRYVGYERQEERADSEYGEAASNIQQPAGTEHHGPSTFTLRDIEDTLSKFSGEGQPEIRQWLSDFEECAITVRWNDLQKYVYARQLLSGGAKFSSGVNQIFEIGRH